MILAQNILERTQFPTMQWTAYGQTLAKYRIKLLQKHWKKKEDKRRLSGNSERNSSVINVAKERLKLRVIFYLEIEQSFLRL